MMTESQGKLEKSQGKARKKSGKSQGKVMEFRVKNLADILFIVLYVCISCFGRVCFNLDTGFYTILRGFYE